MEKPKMPTPLQMPPVNQDQLRRTVEMLQGANKHQPYIKSLEWLSQELDRSHVTFRALIEQKSSLAHDWHKIIIELQDHLADGLKEYLDNSIRKEEKPNEDPTK